jgi:hypothetical protein
MAKQIKANDLFENEDIFKGIRESAEKTISTIDKLNAEFKQTAEGLKSTIGNADLGSSKGINEFTSATTKANQIQKDAIELSKLRAEAEKQSAIAQREQSKAQAEALKTATAEAKAKEQQAKAAEKVRKAADDEASAYKRLEKSTRDLKNQSKELGAQMVKLEQTGQTNSYAYEKLAKQYSDVTNEARKNDKALKELDKTVGDNFRNVGNYEGATKGLKQELRQLTQALQQMETTDPRFAEMAQRAGDLKDQISDTQAVIKATGGTAVETLSKGIAGVGSVGIAAFQGVESSMALMGVQSEAVMETMMRLQALAGLGDALEALGGLGDKLTEIKAAFVATASKMGLFTAAKEVDVLVTEGQIVATETATVATSGLGKAMKALPIVAIIAGLAALAAGVYYYMSSNDKTAKAIEKRHKAEKAAREESEKARDTIAKESTAYVSLIMQLKQTNENSKERKDLIGKINEQYGTTLKNLSDETAFQNQLNVAVRDYIEYQKNKYTLAANEDLITRNLKKQQELEKDISKMDKEKIGSRIVLQNKYNDLILKGVSQSEALDKSGLGTWDEKYKSLTDELGAAQKRMTNYATTSLKLTTETEDKYIPVTEKATKATKEKTKSHQDANEAIQKTLDLMELENQIIEQTQLYETEKDIASAIQAQMEGIGKTGQYQIDLIDQLLTREHDLEAAQIRRKYETQLASKNALEASNAQMAMDLELSQLDDKTKEKRKQTLTDLETAQEDYAAKCVETEQQAADKIAEINKTQWENSAKFAEQTANFFIEQSNKKISQLDKESEAAQQQYDTLSELAANGNINAKESLAEQQRIINEANQRKEKEMRRQQRIKLAESVYSTYAAKVASGSKNPLQETMMETALLQTFIASLPTFDKGIEDTGTNGRGLDGKGGFLSVLHPNERVVPKSLNEQIGSMSNESLAKMAMEYQAGKLVHGHKGAESMQLAVLVNEMRDLKSVIQNKPETNIELGEITQSMMEIVKTTRVGNTHTFNRYKVRK